MSETPGRSDVAALSEADVAPRLRRFTSGLWLDPTEIVGVRSYTDRGSYNRLVDLSMRNGTIHTIVAAYGSGATIVAAMDQGRDEWIAAHLGGLLDLAPITPSQESA